MLTVLLLAASAPTSDIRVPQGFTATLYADHHAANDIYTMAIDDAGRVIVAGKGYVRVLDGGRAFAILDNLKDGPMGLLAEGDSLFVVADGGLKRYRGYNGRDKLTKPPETILPVKTAGEHDAHAVRRGPDGWLYLMCGNMAGVGKRYVTSHRSPVADPVAGSLVRISPDGKDVEIVADGFRNAYSFDFDLTGEPFTYDSDNERCVGLPWYEPCGFLHVVPGGNYGWRSPQLSQTWRKPPYFADVVPPVCTLGRGSPTGVACYRHTHFPKEYQGGFFLADWTFGRIHFVPLSPKGSSWTGTPRVFAEAAGDNGFAPTALAVHPRTGELFVSIGGRGTRGGVYRISHDGSVAGEPLPTAKRSLEWDGDVNWWVGAATSDNAVSRRQALEVLLRNRTELGGWKPLVPAVKANLAHPDPLVRAAAGRLAVRAGVALGVLDSPQAKITLALALAAADPDWALTAALGVLESPAADVGLALQATRVVQLALGDLTSRDAVGTGWEGYTLRNSPKSDLAERVQKALKLRLPPPPQAGPKSSPELDREIARTAAAVGADESNPWLAPGVCRHLGLPESSALDDLHYLAAAGRLTPHALRDEDGRIMTALLNLHTKMQKEQLHRDRHWPMRVDELAAALIPNHRYIPDRLRKHPHLGRPENLPLVKQLKLDPAARARLYATAAAGTDDFAWTPALVKLLEPLPPSETRPVLMKAWERGGLEDAILPLLAVAPEPADVPKFVAGLKSFDAEVVRVSAGALTKLPAADEQADVIAAIRALRRLPDDKAALPAREGVTTFLRERTGGRSGADAKAWTVWFNRNHPKLAAKLDGTDGFDAVAWAKRKDAIPWGTGDAAAGKAVFAKASCAACHDGGRAIGPSLLGVAKRFGRDDLLTTILDPNKDVSPRYRPTRVVTTDGKAHVGMIVYEAVDGVILQTGADTTVRVAGANIESKKTVDTSLMPAGLLDKLTDHEVADLMAYLRALGDK